MDPISAIVSKTRYLIFVKLIGFIINVNGTVFGGVVRDFILHNYAHCAFHEKYSEHMDKFSDPEFAPDLGDRLLIPKDIDCYLDDECFQKFKDILEENKYEIKEYTNSYEFLNVHANTYVIKPTIPKIMLDMLKQFKVDPCTFNIKIDVISNYSLMMDTIDYECNGLTYSGDMTPALNMYLSSNLFYNVVAYQRKLTQIINDIVAKRAIEIKHNASRRRKMISKDFIIINKNTQKPIDTLIDDVCVLCLGNIDIKTYDKFECCEGKYHSNCLREIKNKCDTCPCCRAYIDTTT